MPERPLRILHLFSYHLYTGAAEPVLRLARHQLACGHQVAFAFETIRAGDLAERAAGFGVPVDRRFALCAKAGALPSFRDWLALKKLWAGGELDILHAHRSHDHTLALLARPRRTATALVRTLHTERAQGRRRLWQLRRAHGLVTVSARDRERLLARGVLDPARIVAVEGSVDPVRFCPGPGRERIRAEAGVEPGAPVAGIVARMKPDRGHRLLLQAWRKVAVRIPAARLLLAGRGEQEQQLREEVLRLNLTGSVRFLGFHPDLENVYRALDLKVLLAPGNDGTCRAALEAMATGVPVLATARGALPEIVREGRTGRVVPADDPEALAGALIDLLSDRAALRALGAQARQEAESRFTVARQWAVIEPLYRMILHVGTRSCVKYLR